MILSSFELNYQTLKLYKIEPQHDKIRKMICAPSKDSDQPGHPPSLIRVFAVRMKKPWVLSYPLSAQQRLWQTGRTPRLIWVFAWRTCHFVGFLMTWLNFNLSLGTAKPLGWNVRPAKTRIRIYQLVLPRWSSQSLTILIISTRAFAKSSLARQGPTWSFFMCGQRRPIRLRGPLRLQCTNTHPIFITYKHHFHDIKLKFKLSSRFSNSQR